MNMFLRPMLLVITAIWLAIPANADPSTNGRYQIVYSPQLARLTFLIDTATGRVWQWQIINGKEDGGWVLTPRFDVDSVGPAAAQRTKPAGKTAPAFDPSKPFDVIEGNAKPR